MKDCLAQAALSDLYTMVVSASRDSPSGAVRMYEQIEHFVGFLVEWPKLGREGRTRGVRELIIPHTPYVVLYRRKGKAIHVLRVMHGMQRR